MAVRKLQKPKFGEALEGTQGLGQRLLFEGHER